MIWTLKQVNLNNRYILTVLNGHASVCGSSGTPISFSNIFSNDGHLCQMQLEALSRRGASHEQIRACILKYLPRFKSGPNEGQTTYILEDADPEAEAGDVMGFYDIPSEDWDMTPVSVQSALLRAFQDR